MYLDEETFIVPICSLCVVLWCYLKSQLRVTNLTNFQELKNMYQEIAQLSLNTLRSVMKTRQGPYFVKTYVEGFKWHIPHIVLICHKNVILLNKKSFKFLMLTAFLSLEKLNVSYFWDTLYFNVILYWGSRAIYKS